ncbi:MAG: hypothetical protein Q8N42_00100 [bacterium]|nr:hypothetical protein [bacterium]
MTIVKIKNRVIRWLVGLVIVAAMAVVAAVILYGFGCIVQKILPSIFRFSGGFFGTLFDGAGALSISACGFIIGAGIYVGAKALGNKFFKP